MQVTILINKERNGKPLLEILSGGQFPFDEIDGVVAFLERAFRAVVVEKLESPTLDRIRRIRIDNHLFLITYDPGFDFEITAEEPEGEESLRKIAEALRNWYRERGVLRKFIDEPKDDEV